MALPNVAELFVLPANPPVVAFRQHTHSFDGVVHMLRKLRGRASGRKLIGGTAIPLFNDASMASSGGAAYWPSRIKTSRRLELQRTNWWELSHTLIRRREHGQHRSTD
jgi:hypothetical protein